MNPEIFIQELGKKIRLLRRERNLSQQELGELADISFKYIGEIERGEKNPSILILSRIALALNLDLLDLISLDPPQSSADEVQIRMIRRINRSLHNRPVPELEQVRKILQILYDKTG